jgi:hypothetical protein
LQWLEVAGAPGSGKSTICDPLWGPRAVEWDGKSHPVEWAPFLSCVERLLGMIRHHPSYRTCESMVERSLRKMATVSRMPGAAVYMQTGFAQRALGIGWRLGRKVEAIADYYQTMPVSLGVAFLTAPIDEVQARNVARGKDRSWMVPLVERPRHIGLQVLRARGVPVLEIDALEQAGVNRDRLAAFARAAV